MAKQSPWSLPRPSPPMTRRSTSRRLPGTILAVAAAILLPLLATPAGVEAKVKFRIDGHGYGHGVGMSQWGAYGYAKRGAGYRKILGHYYSRTKLGSARADRVSVLLSVRSNSIEFSNARKACGRDVKPGETYRADLGGQGRKVRLERGNGKRIASCGSKLAAKPAGNIVIDGDGPYRGRLVARAASGGLNVINRVPLEGYIRGVIPNEVPSSWPAEALRAQAVAARSYALATGVDGEGFQLYDDTRSQVYGGASSEQGATNRAAAKTAGKVVKYKGEIVPTFFFSSSGGRTENVELGFPGGSPRPYLKSVRDPYDKASPYHSWRLTYSRSKMESMLGGLVDGKLKKIRITKTGVSPRIVKAKVIGSGGKTTVSGDQLRAALALRSTWAKFKLVRR